MSSLSLRKLDRFLLPGVLLTVLAGGLLSSVFCQTPSSKPGSTRAVQSKGRSNEVTAAEIGAKIEAMKNALTDDPVSAVHRLLAIPPQTESPAAFIGNATALSVVKNDAFVMARQTDCSLTAFSATYMLQASGGSYSAQSAATHFDQAIHAAAGLTTTGGRFARGCVDPGIGVTSATFVSLGQTSAGYRTGTIIGYSSQVQHKVAYVVLAKKDGTLVGATPLPDSTIAGQYPVAALGADLNKDGTNDLILVNSGIVGTGASAVESASVTVALGNPDGTFRAGQSIAIAGTLARGGVVDDFDGDGNLDLAISSPLIVFTGSGSTTQQVIFLPGKGDGTFGTAKVTTGSAGSLNVDGLVSGDFNGDGKKDLVSGYGLVLLGKGDGTFTALPNAAFPTLATTSTGAPRLAAGDFNKDGKLDVAVGTGSSIATFLGNGDGTFSAGAAYASIANAGALMATDLDGDGNLDLYSGTASRGTFGGDRFSPSMGYALMGNGDGTFRGAPRAGGSTTPKTLQDMNGDGKLDYVSMSRNSTTGAAGFQTFLGRGDGTFAAGSVVAVSPITVNGTVMTFDGIDSYTLTDVNGDGVADLVVLPTQGAGLHDGFEVALGKADGSFQVPTFVEFPNLVPGGAGTIYQVAGMSSSKRSDGKTELIYEYVVNSHASPFPFFFGIATQVIHGDGTFAAPVVTVTATVDQGSSSGMGLVTPLNVVDVNGDKDPDLIYQVPAVFTNAGVQTSPAGNTLILGKADGTFGAAKAIDVVDNPYGSLPVTVADVNGDGKADLIELGTSATFQGEVGVALGNGDGTFAAKKVIRFDQLSSGFVTLAAADFDGDGKVDLAVMGIDPPFDSGVLPGNGDGTFQGADSGMGDGSVLPLHTIFLQAYGASIVADVNGDGKPDIGGSVFLLSGGTAATTPVASSTVLAAAPATITQGQTVTLTATVTATVTAASGTAIPTGTVTFSDGAVMLGTGMLSGQGMATFPAGGLGVGVHAIVAAYGGDASFNGSSSTAVPVTVNAAMVGTTTGIAASASSLTVGGPVTFTATVKPVAGTGVPTGTVSFANGSALLGTGTLNGQGVAMLAVTTLPVGTASVTASYGGDTGFTGSVSSAVSVVVNPVVAADFGLGLSAASGTVTSGSSGQTTITLTPAGGFTGAVTLGCSGLPSHATCSFNPAAVTLGAAAGTSVLTIQTGVSASAALRQIVVAVSFACLLGLISGRRRGVRVGLMMAGLVVAGLGASGCGGKSTPSGSSTATPSGTYAVTVTGASGSLAHSSTYTLTVP